MKRFTLLCLLLLPAFSTAQTEDPIVLQDGGVTVTRSELEYFASKWSPQVKRVAAADYGDRLELLNFVLLRKKLALETDKLEPGSEAYFRLKGRVEALKRDFLLEEFVNNLETPDMTALGRERYETEKEKYARVKEQRISSHILFSCPPGACSRAKTKEEAQVVLDALRDGSADFEEMVQLVFWRSSVQAKKW